MTAEVCILNREGVAFASDSAATVELAGPQGTVQKYFPTVDKVFRLGGPEHAVGVMIYQSPVLMDVPWETLIAQFGLNLGRPLDQLEEYVEQFLGFLRRQEEVISPAQKAKHFQGTAGLYLAYVAMRLNDEFNRHIGEAVTLSEDKVREIIESLLQQERDQLLSVPELTTNPRGEAERVVKDNAEWLDTEIEKMIGRLPATDAARSALRETVGNLFFRDARAYAGYTGLVIAGFGSEDTFPALYHFEVEGVANDYLKARQIQGLRIDSSNSATGFVIPFAQQEMVESFMRGVDSATLAELRQYTADSVATAAGRASATSTQRSEEAVRDWDRKVADFSTSSFEAPVRIVVGMLPKIELAAMAEALVSLTSFKRRVSAQAETVGGPTDVAVVSKSDGFQWFKRKGQTPPYPWARG